MPSEMHVAVIGGGIGGLAAAFFLHGRSSVDRQHVFRCTVFEKNSRMGGNCHTAYLENAYQPPFADLAVNDFNLRTYRIMRAVLKRMQEEGFTVEHGTLLDTICFHTGRGDRTDPVSYTGKEMESADEHTEPRFLKTIQDDWRPGLPGRAPRHPQLQQRTSRVYAQVPERLAFRPAYRGGAGGVLGVREWTAVRG